MKQVRITSSKEHLKTCFLYNVFVLYVEFGMVIMQTTIDIFPSVLKELFDNMFFACGSQRS
jgi:hypothetical protein